MAKRKDMMEWTYEHKNGNIYKIKGESIRQIVGKTTALIREKGISGNDLKTINVDAWEE